MLADLRLGLQAFALDHAIRLRHVDHVLGRETSEIAELAEAIERILARLVAIERSLGLCEAPQVPKPTRRIPYERFSRVARFTRPRGFIDWRPSTKSETLLDQVAAVLATYAEQLPLTLRQIFYRLVARFAYEKTERAYIRLGELLNSARGAGRVPMDHIRDDGFVRHAPNALASVDAFLDTARDAAEDLRLDRQRGQKRRRLVVMCEAAGMAPQLARIADPFGIEVLSSGGFFEPDDTHGLAAQWRRQAVTVLQIGDHTPPACTSSRISPKTSPRSPPPIRATSNSSASP
jgi:hypothetical protein